MSPRNLPLMLYFVFVLTLAHVGLCSGNEPEPEGDDNGADENKKTTAPASYFMVGCMGILILGYTVFILKKFYFIVMDRIAKYSLNARIASAN